MNNLKLFKTFFLVVILSTSNYIFAQNNKETFYTDAKQFYLYGKSHPSSNFYHRIDTAIYSNLSPTIKRLLTNSAGLAICFKTNSTAISAKWQVTDYKALANMTPIGQKGLDLYIKRNGQWEFAGVGKPNGNIGNMTIVQRMDNSEKECMLFLPLYDELKSLEIGIDKNTTINPGENPFRHKIIIYGSSIAHGAAASRPGMAYPAQLSRKTGLYFVNIGLSGNAKMEAEAAKMISEQTADAFILDCIPNPTPTEIKERTENFVKTVRNKHPKAPIILVQTIIRELGNFDLFWKKRVEQQNEEAEAAFNRLKASGMKDIYLIKGAGLIGTDHDATTDGTHPSDLGFYRMVEHLAPQITNILKNYGIK